MKKALMKISTQDPTNFSTRDIYLATVIKQSGIPIIKVENNSGRGIFIFKSSKKIEGLISKFFNGELRVDPRNLFETWKALKSLAFSGIKNVI